MLLVIISFTQVFIDTGFGNSLIFKKDRTEIDFSTAFYCSGLLGILIYVLLWIVAPEISHFYNHDITNYIRVIGLGVIFNGLSIIYKTRLTVIIDFRSQAKFTFFAVFSSAVLGLMTAYLNYGIWALIIQNVSLAFFNLLFLFLNLKWIPKRNFSTKSFKELFSYGSKLIYAAIINSIYLNFNSIILGKIYSAKSLGLYSKSYQFTIYPVSTLTNIIQRVFFPYLIKFQDDYNQLFNYNNKYNKLIFVLLLPIITIVILFSHTIIKLILSERWLEMVYSFNLLFISTLFYPLIVMNMNIFQVIGKTTKFLFVEILTKIVGLIIIFLSYKYGLNGICMGILIQFVIQYIITSFFVAEALNESFLDAFRIFLYLFFALVIYCFARFFLQSNLFFQSYLKSLLTIIFICLSYFLLYRFLYKKQIIEFYKKKIDIL